jgi:sulfite reductase (NADPH) hemoprotein beta-component
VAERDALDKLVRSHGLALHETAKPLQRDSLACVALPTCPLAMAEAERYLPDFVSKLDRVLHGLGIDGLPLSLRITGCPNGCARPYLAEIGLVGKAPGRYNLHLGGDAAGKRLNKLFRENLDEPAILSMLETLLTRYAREKLRDERFGDFLWRLQII